MHNDVPHWLLKLYLSSFLLLLNVIYYCNKNNLNNSSLHNSMATHFRITALEENGFLDITESNDGNISYSGYLIDMIHALSQPHRANFTFSLFPPSGYGSCLCSSTQCLQSKGRDTSLLCLSIEHSTIVEQVMSMMFPTNNTHSTDMYLGMYYVTPSRQLQNQFTLPFVPPFSGTLGMFGTATGIAKL